MGKRIRKTQTKQRFMSVLYFSKRVEQLDDPLQRSYLVNPLKVIRLIRQGRDYSLQLQDHLSNSFSSSRTLSHFQHPPTVSALV